jgi:hypothetical protein
MALMRIERRVRRQTSAIAIVAGGAVPEAA